MVMRRSRGSREQQRAAFLAETGALIASSLDHERVLPRLARLAVPALGDLCAIDLLQADGTISRVARRTAVRMADLKKVAVTAVCSSGSVKKVRSCTVTTHGTPGRSGIESAGRG